MTNETQTISVCVPRVLLDEIEQLHREAASMCGHVSRSAVFRLVVTAGVAALKKLNIAEDLFRDLG